MEKNISLKSIERIFKEGNAERIRREAKIALREFLEEIGKKAAEIALRNARHSGRKEINLEDVKKAIELMS